MDHSLVLFSLLQIWWDLEDQVHVSAFFWLPESYCSICPSAYQAIWQLACTTFLEYPLCSTAGYRYLICFHILSRSFKTFGLLWHNQIWSGVILLPPFDTMIVSCEHSQNFFLSVTLLFDIHSREMVEYSVWLVLLALPLYTSLALLTFPYHGILHQPWSSISVSTTSKNRAIK